MRSRVLVFGTHVVPSGAALHGASLSRQFKTKDIRVTDITLYDIQVAYNSESRSDVSKPRTINTLVFPSGSKHGSKKTLTFKRKDDFVLKLTYKSAPAPYVIPPLVRSNMKVETKIITNGDTNALHNLRRG